MELLIFPIHTPSRKIIQQFSYTNKKNENEKLKIQQPFSFTS